MSQLCDLQVDTASTLVRGDVKIILRKYITRLNIRLARQGLTGCSYGSFCVLVEV